MHQKWDAEIVISAIKELHKQGEQLNSNHAQTKHRALYQSACKYHGSWKAAIEASGLSYDSVRVKTPNRKVVWSKKIVVEAIKKLNEEGELLNSNYIQTTHRRLYGAACKYFEGWPQAVAAAGLDYGLIRKVKLRTWSEKALIEAVMQRAKRDLSVKGSVVSIEDRGLYNAARRYFGNGGWAKVRVLAGLTPVDPDSRLKWDKKTVCEEILRLHGSGVALNCGSLQDGDYGYILAAGRKVFGDWAKAIEASGLDYDDIRKSRMNFWTKEEVVRGIRSLETLNVRLSSKAIQHSHGDLFGAAVLNFGSWSQAVEAAGIPYRKHCLTWSTKAWLRRMRPEEYRAVLDSSHQHAQTRRRTSR